MPTQAAPRSAHEITATVENQFNLLEMPWRAWGDAESFGTFYQIGFDAWRNWAEMQMSLMDACWKMSCLTLDTPYSETSQSDIGKSTSEPKSDLKLKKISNG
ncbi:MAG: hypothetical protein U1F34_06050 [Gammaproteobacteria bacterium]